MGGRESGRGVGRWRGAGNFLFKGSFYLVGGGGVGGGRATVGQGDGRSVTVVETRCLSKVKSDLADTTKTLKDFAKQHFMKNL